MFSRRQFLKLGVAGGGLMLFPQLARAGSSEPHFFLQIVLNGGADSSYMFDARPLAMTGAGKIQNYLGQEPRPWVGKNGNMCLASPLTDALLPFKDRFSILNGVFMATNFDGHAQNMNYLLTGNAFGGEYFVPHLNMAETGLSPASVDAIQNGILPAQIENGASLVPIDLNSIAEFNRKLSLLPKVTAQDELIQFVRSRFTANAGGAGSLSQGSRLLSSALDGLPNLHSQLLGVKSPDPKIDNQKQFTSLICNYFRQDVARSAVWVFPFNFDVHAGAAAKLQPQLFSPAISWIADAFKTLLETPYDQNRSMLEVTTVLISTEFSRTMRQDSQAIDVTGTNHNTLNNSLLIGGKGIKGGLVIGQSDFRTASETLSGAHLQLDSPGLKTMGKPLDFSSLLVRQDQPAHFDVANYLTVQSVVNSIYSVFSVPRSKYRCNDRATTTAPVLSALLN